jgi:putative hemolysin
MDILSLFGARQEDISSPQFQEKQKLSKPYADLLSRVTDLKTMTAGQLMTPRALVEALDADVEVSRLHLPKPPVRYLPIYQGDLDHVLGWMNQDAVVNLMAHAPSDSLRNHFVPVQTIPETTSLDQVFLKFVQTSSPLFVVQNEERQTVGVIYLNDVLAQFFGLEIDPSEPIPEWTQTSAAGS